MESAVSLPCPPDVPNRLRAVTRRSSAKAKPPPPPIQPLRVPRELKELFEKKKIKAGQKRADNAGARIGLSNEEFDEWIQKMKENNVDPTRIKNLKNFVMRQSPRNYMVMSSYHLYVINMLATQHETLTKEQFLAAIMEGIVSDP